MSAPLPNAEMQKRVDSGHHHPYVEEATVQAKFPNVVRDRLKAAYKAGLAKLQEYINNPARACLFTSASGCSAEPPRH